MLFGELQNLFDWHFPLLSSNQTTDHGLDYMFDVITTLNVSDVTFFPSRLTHSYDLFAASTDKDDIFFLDLHTGKLYLAISYVFI